MPKNDWKKRLLIVICYIQHAESINCYETIERRISDNDNFTETYNLVTTGQEYNYAASEMCGAPCYYTNQDNPGKYYCFQYEYQISASDGTQRLSGDLSMNASDAKVLGGSQIVEETLKSENVENSAPQSIKPWKQSFVPYPYDYYYNYGSDYYNYGSNNPYAEADRAVAEPDWVDVGVVEQGPPIDIPMEPMPSLQEYFRALNEKNEDYVPQENYDDEYYASSEEIDDENTAGDETEDTETEDTEIEDTETEDTGTVDTETEDTETEDTETEDTETEDTETGDTETKDTETEDTETEDTETTTASENIETTVASEDIENPKDSDNIEATEGSEDTETTTGGSDTGDVETTSISTVSVYPKEAPTGTAGELHFWATKGDGSLLFTTVPAEGGQAIKSTTPQSDDIKDETDSPSKDNENEENEEKIPNDDDELTSTPRTVDNTKKPDENGTESPSVVNDIDNNTTENGNESSTQVNDADQDGSENETTTSPLDLSEPDPKPRRKQSRKKAKKNEKIKSKNGSNDKGAENGESEDDTKTQDKENDVDNKDIDEANDKENEKQDTGDENNEEEYKDEDAEEDIGEYDDEYIEKDEDQYDNEDEKDAEAVTGTRTAESSNRIPMEKKSKKNMKKGPNSILINGKLNKLKSKMKGNKKTKKGETNKNPDDYEYPDEYALQYDDNGEEEADTGDYYYYSSENQAADLNPFQQTNLEDPFDIVTFSDDTHVLPGKNGKTTLRVRKVSKKKKPFIE